jgi:hypothetical protein
MNDLVENRVETLVREVWKDIPVRFDAPANEESKQGVCFVLIGLVPGLISRNDHRQPFQIYRRYLVCSTGADATERASLLEALMFKAMESSNFQMESDPLPNDLWLALGLPPQAAFVVRVPVTHERQVRKAPRVKTMEIDLNPSGTMRGRVFDERGEPVANCLVEIPAHQLRTSTGTDGYFQFVCVSRITSHQIRVVSGDIELIAEAPVGTGFSEPLTLALQSYKQ